jgi:hypothetical protein
MSQSPTNLTEPTFPGPLSQVTYVSGATVPFSADDLAELVHRSREQNEAKSITGILLYNSGSFLHVIEGPPEAVDELFQSIRQDPRHSRILVLHRSSPREREFPGHSLDFLEISEETCAHVPFSSPTLQRLFQDFCAGKWQRAFDCHRKENSSVPICNPFFGAMWGAAEAVGQDDQTNIQVDTSHSHTAQNSGETR